MFEVRGKMYGQNAIIRWDDGKLSGTEIAVYQVLARLKRIKSIGPPGGPEWAQHEVLSHPTPSYLLVSQTMDLVDYFYGDLPPLPAIPNGAIT